MTGPGLRPTASPPPPAPALPETRPVLSLGRAGTPLPAAAPHPPHRPLSGTPPVGCPPAPGRSDRAPRFVANDHSSFLTRRRLPHLPRQLYLGQPPVAEYGVRGNF